MIRIVVSTGAKVGKGQLSTDIKVHKSNVEVLVNDIVEDLVEILSGIESVFCRCNKGTDELWAAMVSTHKHRNEEIEGKPSFNENSPAHGRGMAQMFVVVGNELVASGSDNANAFVVQFGNLIRVLFSVQLGFHDCAEGHDFEGHHHHSSRIEGVEDSCSIANQKPVVRRAKTLRSVGFGGKAMEVDDFSAGDEVVQNLVVRLAKVDESFNGVHFVPVHDISMERTSNRDFSAMSGFDRDHPEPEKNIFQ